MPTPTTTPAATSTSDGLLALFPRPTAIDSQGQIRVDGCDLRDIARELGTPAYVIGERQLQAQAQRFRDAFSARWPNSQVVFASKAYPCTAVVRVMAQAGLGVDVAGGGELVVALRAGVEPAKIVMHGNAKTPAELEMAVRAGVGTIVVDNHDDIDRLERLVSTPQHVLIRVLPGVRPDTYDAVSTGQNGSKFGLPPTEAQRAIDRVRKSRKLVLDGVHMHIGSQILDTAPFTRAIRALAALGEFDVYDLGGGLGVSYTRGQGAPSVEEWIGALCDAATAYLPASARLMIEPGRSLVAQAGLTLYTVTTVKPGTPTFVAVDGGMGDNLDVALYGQPFDATIVARALTDANARRVELVGRHCESGDRLISDIALADPQPGDLLAIPVTGAYCFTMANNYNGALKPPVVFCADGHAHAVVRRETYDELLRRDVP